MSGGRAGWPGLGEQNPGPFLRERTPGKQVRGAFVPCGD